MGQMRGMTDRELIIFYLYMAGSVVAMGTSITFVILYACTYYNIDILTHLWLLGIPPLASLLINVLLIEIYRKIVIR
jgi:hypothetical protein